MDLKNVSKLSDEQLIELYRNPAISSEIKDAVLKTIQFRELNELKSQKSKNNADFTNIEKLKLMFLPFYTAIIENLCSKPVGQVIVIKNSGII
ncbi:hypothetical protein [uncultured Algibacter sp.]|uniref:hypothetical protein n=1 Tax=uncultured Algibacter sp. TaxID=298659 RepID=UPI0032180286